MVLHLVQDDAYTITLSVIPNLFPLLSMIILIRHCEERSDVAIHKPTVLCIQGEYSTNFYKIISLPLEDRLEPSFRACNKYLLRQAKNPCVQCFINTYNFAKNFFSKTLYQSYLSNLIFFQSILEL